MDIPEGSKLGALMEGAEKTAAEVYMGRAIPVGPLRGIPVWDASSGVRVLFLLPLSGCMVKKSGRRQGGAFLLGPGESFSLRGTAQEETVFQFKAASAVEVIPGTGALCGFCRAPLAEGVPGCLSLTPGNPLAGKVLCLPCAQAWEIFVSP